MFGGNMSNGLFGGSGGGSGGGGGGGYGGDGRSGRGGGGGESTTLLVKNLPFSTTWQTLKDKFKEAGDVKFAEIAMDNGRSRGYGTVKMGNVNDARRAISLLNGKRIDNRQVEVMFE